MLTTGWHNFIIVTEAEAEELDETKGDINALPAASFEPAEGA